MERVTELETVAVSVQTPLPRHNKQYGQTTCNSREFSTPVNAAKSRFNSKNLSGVNRAIAEE
ncbi:MULTISPECIES: hypothetical protein [unclassified Leptolyngbya]|uniref:hypothetical protein n=1 Tax=unclassified Leptolyngbya TaxID=2650499 RepID=UPI00168304F8|nr:MULTISPECIES: hypothetical protein [unclassified Leptolyngbya]MBD1909355.1 hypothetical protein [Leptolyngbya sp. FACHB-8]MBD2156934.1 hypothetical protein [Leptolyngbya sp. FACHB-16]